MKPVKPAPRAAAPAKAPKLKAPRTLGACADRLYELKALKAQANKAVAAIEAEESFLKEHLINKLPKDDASGVAGRVARVTVMTKLVPSITDFPKLLAFALKTKAYDLVQHRANGAAIQARWDAKVQVPGVDAFRAVTVSLNKL